MQNDPFIGRQLANFRVERLLGQGGMARVYYGHDVKLERPVAIKVIHPRYQDNPASMQRFIREARAIAAWHHQHIIQVYYADDHDGLSYFVMEYIDGQDLGRLLSQHARDKALMAHSDVLRIGRAIASALDYAHRKGVIHRDVKPSNVFISEDGRIVLGDFGLALDMQEGTIGEVFGTPHYISPEQAQRSSNAVPQSDLYSLGIILYEMLTGAVPFDDMSPTSVAVQHVMRPPPPPRTINPALNEATERVLLKALSKASGDRYQSGAELMDALEEAVRAPSPALAPAPAGLAAEEPLLPTPGATSPLYQPAAAPLPAVRPPSRAAADQPTTASQAVPPAPDGQASTVRLAQPQQARTPRLLALAGGLGVILVMVVVLFNFLGGTAAESTEVTQGETVSPLAGQPAATEPTSVPTAAPSAPAQPAADPTTAPAEQKGSQPAASAVPASPTPVATPSPAPTQPPAGGKKVALYYDQHTFYLVNLTGDTLNVGGFAFERLGNEGQVVSRFEGGNWPYRQLKNGRCSRFQALNTPRLPRPAECERESSSLERNPARTGITFWVAQEGSSAFRVLWHNQEVGRCESSAGSCQVFLP